MDKSGKTDNLKGSAKECASTVISLSGKGILLNNKGEEVDL